MTTIDLIDPELVKQIEWCNDPVAYDLELQKLGEDSEEFIVPNPNFALCLDNLIPKIPTTKRCVVWWYEGQWIAKRFTANWRPEFGYHDIALPRNCIKFNFLWIKNPELENIRFENDPYRSFSPSLDDAFYELVWYLDSNYCPDEKDIWVVKCINQDNPCLGPKDMGQLTPDIALEYNPYLPKLEYEIDYQIALHDFAYEHVWLLDEKHCESAPEEIWAVKASVTQKPEGTKIVGKISPSYTIELNPDLPDLEYDVDYIVPYYDFEYEHIWMLDEQHCETAPEPIWAFKLRFTDSVQGSKIVGEASPIMEIEQNPELPELMYEVDYTIPYHDFDYEHIWMLDKKHCVNAPEEIWAFKVRLGKDVSGTKIVGEVSPSIEIEFNPELPELSYDIEYTIPYHDLGYEHVWMLDEKHCENAPEEIWAVKMTSAINPTETKFVSSISPKMSYTVNDDVKGYSFTLPTPIVQYHDFSYVYNYTLDTDYSGYYDIWAVKLQFTPHPEGEKDAEYIAPIQKLIYNKALKNIPRIKVDYKIPYHDRQYEHVWYLNENFTSGDKVWVAKLIATDEPIGLKEMGVVTPIIPDVLDVFFISYNEPNAEKNWKRVQQKAPWAKRINGVKGIFEAHYAAAEQSTTDMFYVVDGDAYLVDAWKFNYQPGVFDRDCAYVWRSKNPVNGLTYGYAGVKLFSKKEFLKTKKWTTLDMTTGIMSKLCVMQKVSNITEFNTDEFSTWKSAFRECVKLKYNAYKEPGNPEHVKRLAKWKTANWKKTKNTPAFAEYATDGAIFADLFFEKEKNKEKNLRLINDFDWVRKQFDERYGTQSDR